MGARRLGDVMKLFLILFCLSHVCLFPALLAQGNRPDREGARPGNEPRGERGPRRGPEQFLRRLPVVQALDSDGDLIITGEEMKAVSYTHLTLPTNREV